MSVYQSGTRAPDPCQISLDIFEGKNDGRRDGSGETFAVAADPPN